MVMAECFLLTVFHDADDDADDDYYYYY